MKRRRGGWRALALLAGSSLLLTACRSEVTSTRLERSVSSTYLRLLVLEQHEVGLPAPDLGELQTQAACGRGADASGHSGAGEDWSCLLNYSSPGGTGSVRLEVQARPDGCWRADGAVSSVGPPTLTVGTTGRRVANPLSEFDGCFDTSVGADR